MPKSSFFRRNFRNQRVHGSQTLTKSARQHFYPKFLLIQDKLSDETSLLVRSEILRLFGKTVTDDHMYYRHNWHQFRQQIQTPLSPKVKIVSQIFFAFLKSTENFAYFQEKDQLHSLNILEVIDSERCGYLNARKLLFQNTVRESTWKKIKYQLHTLSILEVIDNEKCGVFFVFFFFCFFFP